MSVRSDIPAWVRPENMRWAAYQWENLVHFRRMGGKQIPCLSYTGWTEKYFDRLFSERTVREFADLGFTVLATNFYKGFGLQAEREEIARQIEFVKICHRHGLRVIGYINSLSAFYETLFKEEPGLERRLRVNPDGSMVPTAAGYEHGGQLCFSHHENVDFLKKIITACMESGFDGIHFDRIESWPCYCEKCTAAFRTYLEEHVKDKRRFGFLGFEYVRLPRLDAKTSSMGGSGVNSISDPMAQEWIKFRMEQFASVRKELYTHVKSFGTEKAVCLNALLDFAEVTYGMAVNPKLMAQCADSFYVEGDSFPYYSETGDMRSCCFGYKLVEATGCSAIPTQWCTDKNGLPALPGNPSQVKAGLIECAAFGGVPGVSWACRTIGGEHIKADVPELAEAVKSYFAFFSAKRHLYADSQSFPDIALLYSVDSFSFEKSEVHKAFESMIHILSRNSVPFSVVFDDDIGKLTECKLLIIANQIAMTRNSADKLKNFVRKGGALLLTGRSGDFDEHVLLQEGNLLEEVLSNPRVRRILPAPELDVEQHRGAWFKRVVRQAPKAGLILSAVDELLGADSLFKAAVPDGVVMEPRLLPHGKVVVHFINYKNGEGSVHDIMVTFNAKRLNFDGACLHTPEHPDVQVNIQRDGIFRLATLQDYAVLELKLIGGDAK